MEAISVSPETYHVHNSSCFAPENLLRLKQNLRTHHFSVGSILYHEGDKSDHLYYIHSGRVKITKLSEGGKEYLISLFHSGDFLGEFDFTTDSKHSFSAQIIEECEIGCIQKKDLEILLWQYGDLSLEFMKWMGYMHQLTQTKLRDLIMYGKPGALCSTLIRLSNAYGSNGDDGVRISLKLTNSNLADYIGSARESVNRMLGDLRKAGAIVMNEGYITITNLKYLQNICKCESCPKELCRL